MSDNESFNGGGSDSDNESEFSDDGINIELQKKN